MAPDVKYITVTFVFLHEIMRYDLLVGSKKAKHQTNRLSSFESNYLVYLAAIVSIGFLHGRLIHIVQYHYGIAWLFTLRKRFDRIMHFVLV